MLTVLGDVNFKVVFSGFAVTDGDCTVGADIEPKMMTPKYVK